MLHALIVGLLALGWHDLQPASSSDPVATGVGSDSEPEVELVIERAEAATAAGRHAEAAEIMRQVHAITGNPADLLAVALAEQSAGNCREATLVAARVMANPGSDRRFFAPARRIARECEVELQRAASPDPPAPEPPSSLPEASGPPPAAIPPVTPANDSRERAPARDPLAISLTAFGSAGLATGAGLLAAAHQSERRAEAADDESRYDRDIRRAMGLQAAGIAAVSIGAALVCGGIVRWVVVARRARKRGASARIELLPAAGLALAGRF